MAVLWIDWNYSAETPPIELLERMIKMSRIEPMKRGAGRLRVEAR